jgi:hypothetical protein
VSPIDIAKRKLEHVCMMTDKMVSHEKIITKFPRCSNIPLAKGLDDMDCFACRDRLTSIAVSVVLLYGVRSIEIYRPHHMLEQQNHLRS